MRSFPTVLVQLCQRWHLSSVQFSEQKRAHWKRSQTPKMWNCLCRLMQQFMCDEGTYVAKFAWLATFGVLDIELSESVMIP
jgi:hypothetical protein